MFSLCGCFLSGTLLFMLNLSRFINDIEKEELTEVEPKNN